MIDIWADHLASLVGVDLSQFVAVFIVAALAGFARGFSGFGSGLIFVPLASVVLGPKTAVPLLLLLDLFGSVRTLPAALPLAERRPLATILAGGLLGLPAGILILLFVDTVTVRWIVCVAILGLLALIVSGKRYRGPLNTSAFVGVGMVAGVFSGIAQIGGPPIIAFWMGVDRPANIVRANLMAYMSLSTIVSFGAYLMTGLINWNVIAIAITTAPAFLVGVGIGLRLYPRASPRAYMLSAQVLILVAATLGMPIFDRP